MRKKEQFSFAFNCECMSIRLVKKNYNYFSEMGNRHLSNNDYE